MPAPIWCLTTICNSGSRAPMSSSGFHWHRAHLRCTDIHTGKNIVTHDILRIRKKKLCWFGVKISEVDTAEVTQRKDDKHLVFDGSGTVAKGGRTAQGDPFNQHDRTARVTFPSALCLWFCFVSPYSTSAFEPKGQGTSRKPAAYSAAQSLASRLIFSQGVVRTNSEPRDPLKRFTSVAILLLCTQNNLEKNCEIQFLLK